MAGLAEVEITGIAAGGDGVGRTNGLVVFVPRTAVGDTASVRIKSGKRFARGTLDALVLASGTRTTPQCSHYVRDRCGGCQLQHIEYAAQLEAKSAIVMDSLRRIGKRDVGRVDVIPSAAEWRYRRKLTLHLRRVGTRFIAGLHPYDSPAEVFDLRECPITEDAVVALWQKMRSAFQHLPDVGELRVAVRRLRDGFSVTVEGASSWHEADRFFDAMPSVTELWWKPDEGRLRRLRARGEAPEAGASFVQVNAGVADALHEHVLTRVRAHAPDTVIDAYAGSGATAIPLARTARVTAIELDREAVALLALELSAPSRTIGGKVEEHLERALPADVVLLNPPRGGVDERVTQVLESADRAPRAIVYTSCDPATLARDLARMPRYRIASIRAFDMFPQTAHVETVCELVPEAA